MEVFDAETGERLVIASSPSTPPSTLLAVRRQPQRLGNERSRVVSFESLPAIAVTSSHTALSSSRDGASKHRAHGSHVYPETQSLRPIGASVDWRQAQDARVERSEERFRESLPGLRRELERRDLTAAQREKLKVQILEKMKAMDMELIQRMVTEELQRELDREVEMRLELSAIGRARLQSKHEHDRAFRKEQIERIRAECQLRLAATMAQYNLLR
ncbi:hypothetical protein PINS_up013452 [Pythium insidiosum]|nr:hypothetical protein PINS_up013452 [Pythium insidiosum]